MSHLNELTIQEIQGTLGFILYMSKAKSITKDMLREMMADSILNYENVRCDLEGRPKRLIPECFNKTDLTKQAEKLLESYPWFMDGISQHPKGN